MSNIVKYIIVASGTAIGTGSNFLMQVFLANKLSTEGFGFFTSIFNIVNLISPLIAFGVTGFLLKCYGEEGYRAKKWFKSVLIFNLITVIFSFFVFNLFFLEEKDKLLVFLFFIYMASISFNNFNLMRFQVGERFGSYAFWLGFPNFMRLVLLFLFISYIGVSILSVGILFSVSSIIVLLYSFYSMFLMSKGDIYVKYEGTSSKSESSNLLNLLKNSYPYGLSGLFYLIYYQIDIVVLKYYVSYTEIAYYGVSILFISAICLLPTIYYQQICMPKIHYWAAHNVDMLKLFYRKNLIYSLFLGVFFYILINFFIEKIIFLFFDDKYLKVLDFFYILSIVIIFKFISQSSGAILNSGKFINQKVKIMGAAALLNLISNLILIKFYGLNGAIYSTILTELFLVIYFSVYLKLNIRKLYG